jgi:hypothetical protein
MHSFRQNKIKRIKMKRRTYMLNTAPTLNIIYLKLIYQLHSVEIISVKIKTDFPLR